MGLELGLGNDSELASYLFLTTFMMLGNSLFCDPVPHPWKVMLVPAPRDLTGKEMPREALVFIKCLILYPPCYVIWEAGDVFSYDHQSPVFH